MRYCIICSIAKKEIELLTYVSEFKITQIYHICKNCYKNKLDRIKLN